LAWAITIHKSQGLTFERAVIDAGEAFAAGQVYVALSRCTHLEGMVLRSRIASHSLKSDQRIVDFSNEQQSMEAQLQMLEIEKNKFQSAQIKENFDFTFMRNSAHEVLNFITKEATSFNADAINVFEKINVVINNTHQTGERFEVQLNELLSTSLLPEKNEILQTRIKAAANHFSIEIEKIKKAIEQIFIETDSKILAGDLYKQIQQLYDEVCFKYHVIKGTLQGFAIDNHLQHKKVFKKITLSINFYSGVSSVVKTDIPHPDLYRLLKNKRDEICDEKNQPVYLVAKTSTLVEMVLYLPQTITQLNNIAGFGPVKSRQYGKDFLDIICDYCESNGLSSTVDLKPQKTKVPKKTTEIKTTKKDKPDTKAISFELFKSGKTIEDIAFDRNLTAATIEGHLSYFIEQGELDISEILSAEKINIIQDAIAKYGNTSTKTLKENLPDEISYGEIRMVLGKV
jgi:hypothetical protein